MEPKFKRLEAIAPLVYVGLGLTVAADLYGIWADAREIQLLNALFAGNLPSSAAASAADHRQSIASIVSLVALALTGAAFIFWFRRAYVNLPALGARGLRYSNGWTIGAWFVPFLNLVRPKRIADDIWRASDPEAAPEQGAAWLQQPVSRLITLWWAISIIGRFVAPILLRGVNTSTPGGLRTHDTYDLIITVIDIAGAVLAALVVREITQRQRARARAIESRLAAAGLSA